MLYHLFENVMNQHQFTSISMLITFVITAFTLNLRLPFLPKDQGREFAVNGELSKGKIRGVGIIMVFCFLVCASLFVPFSTEFLIYMVLLLAEMISGYLDDASSVPWSDYKKGLIDFIVSVSTSFVFVINNSSAIKFGDTEITLHPALYITLGTILIWMSINATNCADGVDSLCGSLSIVTLLSISAVYASEITSEYHLYNFIFVAVILAYLLFNSKPSSMLMGDAGSRAIGLFIAIMVMKSGHPVCYILLAAVLIVDGIAGLLKIFLKRFFKICILKNTRTPIHDEMRKNHNWSDTQVVIRFSIVQVLFTLLWFASGI